MPDERKNKFCSNCGAGLDINAKICPKCGVEQQIIPEKVSSWWYVFSIIFGLIGGVIAWAVNKDRNPKKAMSFIIVALVLWIIPTIGILATIVLVNVSSARTKAKDSSVMASMAMIRTSAEMIFDQTGDSYDSVGCSSPEMASLCSSIKTYTEEEPTIYSTQSAYCAFVRLPLGGYYCIDSNWSERKTLINPSGAGYCDGVTYSCP